MEQFYALVISDAKVSETNPPLAVVVSDMLLKEVTSIVHETYDESVFVKYTSRDELILPLYSDVEIYMLTHDALLKPFSL